MNLSESYKELCNCGYTGTFLDYIKSIGITLEDLDKLENVEKKRVRIKGHYRVIIRDKEIGIILSSKKWSPKITLEKYMISE